MKQWILILLLIPFLGLSQAKKPTLMVVPSDRFCIENGYFIEVDDYGITRKIPDYKKALQSSEELGFAITQMSTIMAERGFPLKDLEMELKRIETEALEVSLITGKEGGMINESPIDVLKRTAKADIILNLDFSIKGGKLGMHYANFNLKGVDAYTSKVVAGASGSGKPFMTDQVELLLQMAVKDHMDNFNSLLLAHFEDMLENGREIAVQIKIFDTSYYTFYDEFSYETYEMTDELSYIIEEFFNRNTVKERFTIDDVTETNMRLSQVRIPLYDNRQRAMDSRGYIRKLKRVLAKAPFNLESKIYVKGLGEVWLIIGEK